jgi:hypothetical protein
VNAPFVTTLRTTDDVIRAGEPGPNPLQLRVQIPDRWDVMRVAASAATSVRAVKEAALESSIPGEDPEDYVIKLRGFEVLDEDVSLADAGARNGSIFLLTHRRRRPVR